MTPEVLVCAGGGGVGKTTSSTALAMTLARSGKRTLIVTIDPARRLADALAVSLGPAAQRIGGIDGDGVLMALMPEADKGMRTFADILFEHEPEARRRIGENRIYQTLEDTVPGIQELVAMHLVSKAVIEHRIENVVVDTAPSRFALDFITYPARLAKLLEGRAMAFLSKMAGRSGRVGRVEKLVGQVMGPSIASAAEMFSDLSLVRERFVAMNQRAAELLFGPRTRYLVVLAPTGGRSRMRHTLWNS